MAVDLSGFGFFTPLFAFLLVFVVILGLLIKTKILGDNKFINIFISFALATIFVSVSSIRVYVQSVIPWFVVLIVAIFLVLLIVGFTQKDIGTFMKPGFGWVFIVLLIIIFIFAAVKVFSPVISPWLPGYSSSSLDPLSVRLKEFVWGGKFLGSVLLLILAAIVAWVITRKVK